MSDLTGSNDTGVSITTALINSALHFIQQHVFVFLRSGSVIMYDGSKQHICDSGDYYLIERNSLVKFIKNPVVETELEIVEIQFAAEFIMAFSVEYGLATKKSTKKASIIKLKSDPLLLNYLQSRQPYEKLKGLVRENLLLLKNKELLLLLLNLNPELQNVLFNFDEPEKADLEDYMSRNFRFNLSLTEFAYLTGRSLTSFKRDFEKTFQQAPGRWLLDKRLDEARNLIEKEGKKPIDVYLEVGFEDLSHFSFAFKKKFGASPKHSLKKDET